MTRSSSAAPTPQDPTSFVEGRPADAADILALSRAAGEALHRALRMAPEARVTRVLSRWPADPEEILLELDPADVEMPVSALADRVGASAGQMRAAALALQRLSLVRVSGTGVRLTVEGRRKRAQLDAVRARVMRRIASGIEVRLSPGEARLIMSFLKQLLEGAEAVVDEDEPGADG